ncbi:hypothetical protein N0V82_005980 [Gnomoniopsis sp. IMI 355080]|nr:hypothetical protein N0V82_005980 [Gnomoniopsis sp. IMI 355080]
MADQDTSDNDGTARMDKLTNGDLKKVVKAAICSIWRDRGRDNDTVLENDTSIRSWTEKHQNWPQAFLSSSLWISVTHDLNRKYRAKHMAKHAPHLQWNRAPPTTGPSRLSSAPRPTQGVESNHTQSNAGGSRLTPTDQGGDREDHQPRIQLLKRIERTLDRHRKSPSDSGTNWTSLKESLYARKITHHDSSRMCDVLDEARVICLPVEDISRRNWEVLLALGEKRWIRRVNKMLGRIHSKLHRHTVRRGHGNFKSKYEPPIGPAPRGMGLDKPPAQIIGDAIKHYNVITTSWAPAYLQAQRTAQGYVTPAH